MARHIAEGGTPYDAFGQHITEMMSEMDTMARFVRAARGRGFTGEAAAMVESAIRHYADLKSKAKRMVSQRGYREERDTFRPDQFTEAAVAAEAIRDMFIEQTLDHRIEEALPVLARIAEQERTMAETDQFESWAASVIEGRDPNRLQDLMSRELTVGPDAANATEQLYGVLDDEELFDILRAVAEQDPDANAWDDPAVQRRMTELGIEKPVAEPEIEATPMPENFGGGGLQGAPIGGTTGGLERSIGEEDMEEDIDTDGIMMNKPSNMSSESIQRLRQLSRV
jgi:hypothetical protein